MTELVLCSQCRRHVAVRETACPFCGAAVTSRPQHTVVTRIARAAIFSAALGACSDKHAPSPPPAPPTAPATHGTGSGNDDLEKLLDNNGHDEHVVDHAVAPIDAGVALAPPDASVAIDAGVDPQLEAQKRRREQQRLQRLREQAELRKKEREQQLRIREMAKPYGAPPARRRVV